MIKHLDLKITGWFSSHKSSLPRIGYCDKTLSITLILLLQKDNYPVSYHSCDILINIPKHYR